MLIGVKGRRCKPLLRLGSYKLTTFRWWVVDEITECIAVDDFEIMDKFNSQKLEENVDVFVQALNKYLAEYEKAGICPKHFENMTEFVEDYNKKIFEDI